ncbi:vacuolar protein 8 [Angomonas deanei]|nr:vacuolar protein 8 [Angomonas deanei]|eukprot:EPY25397.1 vacuolar protein 8 [Angomonas deanei]
MIVSGSVPVYSPDVSPGTNEGGAAVGGGQIRTVVREEEDGLPPSKSAPEPSPVKTHLKTRPKESEAEKAALPPASPRSTVSGNSLIAMLRLPEVSEASLLGALENYERQTFTSEDWLTAETYPEILDLLLALLKHLPEPRPPVQLAELHILGNVLQASPGTNGNQNNTLYTILESLVKKGNAIVVLSGLLSSVNDDVKCEALELLSPLICGTQPLVNSVTNSDLFSVSRVDFLRGKGLEPLVNIVVCSTSEAVLERALVFLWGLLSKDEKSDAANNGGRSIRTQVRELGGLRAVLDLLYTDSLSILENVCMVIGYITREDVSKNEIRNIGGLEKITATLRHPSDSIKTKMAGAVWNCASNAENRAYLRQLGAIPALLELLKKPEREADPVAYEFVRENAAGALWNLSVDAENKTMILEYGGVPILVQVMSSSQSVAVVENVSGTLWNCSASVETRPLIRKCGGIPVLLSLIDGQKATKGLTVSDKILDNAAGTLRNCAINDQNKPAIQNAGGVELLLRKINESLTSKKAKLPPSTVDKLASTLWILTISPDIKQTIRTSGGIESVLNILKSSSPVLAAAPEDKRSPFPTFKPVKNLSTAADYEKQYYSPSVLHKIPSANPSITVSMSIKEKLVGVIRNCSTIPENRVPLIKGGAVSALTAVILDCYSSLSLFQNATSHKNGSRLCEPSVQLKETAASALWYCRDDKVTTREQGGLELMCAFC